MYARTASALALKGRAWSRESVSSPCLSAHDTRYVAAEYPRDVVLEKCLREPILLRSKPSAAGPQAQAGRDSVHDIVLSQRPKALSSALSGLTAPWERPDLAVGGRSPKKGPAGVKKDSSNARSDDRNLSLWQVAPAPPIPGAADHKSAQPCTGPVPVS